MRKYYYIALILFLFAGYTYSQNGEVNQTDEKGRKQGVWKKYYAPDTLRYEGQFKDNRPVGTFKYYYRHSALKSVLTYEKGTKDTIARAKIYFPTGDLMATGRYVNREKDENWLYYNYDSILIAEEKYIRGKRYGDWKVYFEDGSIAEIKTYDNDLEQGPWKQFYENGQVKVNATYKDGALEGMASYYDYEGNLTAKGSFRHGVKHGIWEYYNDEGEVVKTEEYENGRKVGGDEDSLIKDSDLEHFYRNKEIDLDEMLRKKEPEK